MTINICQIALSVTDGEASTRFYERLFGLQYVFGTRSYRGRRAEQIQGVPGSASHVRWLIDDRAFFQFELFAFENPQPKPARAKLGLNHIGYNRLFFDVASLVLFEQKAHAMGVAIEYSRRGDDVVLLVRDPDGVPIEVSEDAASAGRRGVRLAGLALSVHDLPATVAAFVGGLEFTVEHNPPIGLHEDVVGRCLLRRGDMRLLALQPRVPIARPDDYLLCDIGIMNVAVGFTTPQEYRCLFDRAVGQGFVPNCPPMGDDKTALCTYLNDPQGFSVEMLYVAKRHYGLVGFSKPGQLAMRINAQMEQKALAAEKRRKATAGIDDGGLRTSATRTGPFAGTVHVDAPIAAPPEKVWDALMDITAHAEWDPMLEIASLDPVHGGTVKFAVKLPNGRKMPLQAKISRIEPAVALAWRGGSALKISGEHYFTLQPDGLGGTLFGHGEHYGGLLLPMAWKQLARSGRMYAAMAQALKRRVEDVKPMRKGEER